MIINDATKLGSGGSNLVLETAGKVYIKVADRFYELDFKNQGGGTTRLISSGEEKQTPEIDMSQYVTKKYLRSSLNNYVTTRGWSDVKATQKMLQEALLDGYTESISPITIDTMQLIVGNSNLQFDFIQGLLDGTPISGKFLLMEDSQLQCPDTYIKHYTLHGPSAVKPNTGIQYYARWTVSNPEDASDGNTYLNLENDELSYYVYIRAQKYSNISDDYVEAHLADDPKGQNTATFVLSSTAIELEKPGDDGYYYFLCAIISDKTSGSRSIAYMNGFTEIVPGQITAYVFKTPDGTQYMDFLEEKFRIGNSETGLDWNVTTPYTLTVKGNMEVVGGPLREELDELEGAISNDYLKKVIKDGRTTIEGGLILSNIIGLGHSTVDAQDPTYWEHFSLESGISGICQKYSANEGYYDIAAWFGGKMVDKEKDNLLQYINITNSSLNYERKENLDRDLTLYLWSNGSGGFLTTSNAAVEGSAVYRFDENDHFENVGTVQEGGANYTITIYNSHFDEYPEFAHSPSGDFTLNGVTYYAWVETTNLNYHERYTTTFTPTTSSTLYHYDGGISWDDPPEVDSNSSVSSLTQSGRYIKFLNNYFIRQSETTSQKFFGWKNESTTYYTDSEPPLIGSYVWQYSNSTFTESVDTVTYYEKGYANSVFRMNGSGYLSGGDISWDTEGNLIANNITVNSGKIGGLLINSSGIFNNTSNPTISITPTSAILSNAEIDGALSTRIQGDGQNNFISLADRSGSPIIRINGSSLDTTAVPTFLYLDHGTVIWEGTVGQWWTYYHWGDNGNGERLVLKRVRAVKDGILTIPAFGGYFWLFGQGMTPYGTLAFYVKSWVNNNPIYTTVANLGTFYGNEYGVNNRFIVPAFSMYVQAGREYLLCLNSSGALESGFNTSTGFRISVDNTTHAYITYTGESSDGVFIGANGMNIHMAKNSCLTYLVPKVTFSNGLIQSDSRGNGGIFKVMIPSISGSSDETNALGIEIQSYKDPSGTSTTPAFRLNLGSGWKTLSTSGGTPLYLSD